MNRWHACTEGMGKRFIELMMGYRLQLIELGRQRLGRVDTKLLRDKTIYRTYA